MLLAAAFHLRSSCSCLFKCAVQRQQLIHVVYAAAGRAKFTAAAAGAVERHSELSVHLWLPSCLLCAACGPTVAAWLLAFCMHSHAKR
jgi:hypothetical protein